MSHRRAVTVLIFGLLMAGPTVAADWPDWVLNPPGNEPAGSACVPASKDLSSDRDWATAKAREALAQQIEVKVEAMDETYDGRIREGKAEQRSSSFKSVSKQISTQSIRLSKVVRSDTVKVRKGLLGKDKFFCVLVAMAPEAADKLPKDIIRAASVKVDESVETQLLARFRQVVAARAAPGSDSEPGK